MRAPSQAKQDLSIRFDGHQQRISQFSV